MSEERINEIIDILNSPHLHCYLPNVCNELLQVNINLQQKVEQLENIRKEAIEYIKNNSYFESNIVKTMILGDYSSGLLNILNKGSEE